ncbi:MAG: radical SAM protein [Clostridia bacterium]|nr:radical SAM protein [Clostridia bacterium]
MHYAYPKAILSAKNGMNLYRGCTHGCIYCDSRSACYGFTHDFEDIEVKINAPELLEKALKAKRHKCMIGTGSMCDPYLPLEKELCLTRRCLEIISRYGFGAALQTKSTLVLRDVDLLCAINRKAKAVVQMTLTTADEQLCRLLEPNVAATAQRADALLQLKEAGIPTAVWLSPLLPFINDTEENMNALLDICIRAGVRGIVYFGAGVTLREGDREYFYRALDRHFPGMKERYARTYGNAYAVMSPNAPALDALLSRRCREHGILCRPNECFAYLTGFPKRFEQVGMFDE